jgi:hypothetical protein
MDVILDFTNEDFKAAVDREIAKRLTTYPRIMAKLQKKGSSFEELAATSDAHIFQMYNLQNIRFCLQQFFVPSEPSILDDMIAELKREFKMRKKCYPRWVWFHSKSEGKSGISQDTATFELAIWKALIIHFENDLKNGTGI